jgi:serine/threonine-protein kinase
MIDAPSSVTRIIRFGPFELDLRSGELRKNGSIVGLQDQPLQVLSVLLERRGELVTREELRQRLWPADTFVDFEHGLNAAVKRLRDTLGDSADAPRFIETIPRRGYRFKMTIDNTATLSSPTASGIRSRGRWIRAAIGAALVATALPIASRVWQATRAVDSPAPVHFTLEVEQSGVTAAAIVGGGAVVAVCPDGSCVAYRGAQQGIARLYLHHFNRLASAAIPNTEGGYGPFFSPDGRWLGFFADGRLKKISLDKLDVETLCDAPDEWGATWAPDGHIFFAATGTGPIMRVSAEGGGSEPVTRLDEGSAEVSHRWPVLLPDGDRLLFQSTDASGRSRIVLQALGTGRRQTLLDRGEYPRFAASGHLLFSVGASLWAVPLNAGAARLDGPAVDLTEKTFGVLGGSNRQGMFDVSRNGVFAYIQLSRRMTDSTLWRVERSGRANQLTDLRRAFQWPRFSPDGRRLAVTITDGVGSNIWTYDLLRQSLTRLTFDGDNEAAIWSPDGRRFAFRSNRAGPFNLFQMSVDGAGPVERLVTSNLSKYPGSWSPDGRELMFQEQGLTTDFDLWILSLTGDHSRQPFVNSQYGEWDGLFSPDGRRVAYTSLESGRLEVYVRSYRGPGGKRQVSNEGGNSPVWSRSGKELFYMNGRKMMVVTIGARSELTVGKPELLFEGDYAFAGYLANFDVTPDDRAFVMVRSEQSKSWVQLNVVLNWFDELKRRVPRQP